MLKSIRQITRKAYKIYKHDSSTVNFSKKFHKHKKIFFRQLAALEVFHSTVASALIFSLAFGALFFSIEPKRALADDTGFLSFATNAAVASSAGDNNGFTNGVNAASNDGVLATDNNSGSTATTDGCATFPQSEDDQHDFYDFTISVTAGSTINGIEVAANAFVAQPATGDDQLCVALSWNAGTNWTTAKGTGELATADGTTYTLGGAADTWGRTWSTTELSNTNFRIRVMPDSAGAVTPDYSLDYLGLKVYYTPPPTTTLGDGTDGSNSTIAPGASATEIDRFSFTASAGTDTVTALTVTLGPSSAFNNIATVDVQTTGGASKCSATPSSNTVSLTSCAIAVTTTPTEYKIMITPKTHANMAAPDTGASYATTATVTDWTGTNTHAGSDTDSATVTVDNLSPANVTSATGTAGDTQVSLSWTNPADSDFEEVVVLRRASSAVADTPVEGTSYATTTAIGSSVVACEGNMTACTDTGLTNGTAYHYKIFAKDSRNNYSATGVVPTGSPFTPEEPPTPVTTLGAGSDPASATVAPGSAIRDAGTFTLETNVGSDSVTALTVTLAGSGTPYNGVAEVRVTSSDGSTLYFAAVTTFDSNTVSFSGGTAIPVSTTQTSFKIRVTPKSHANMAAPVGASYALSPSVSGFTSTNGQAGSDSNANTLTIDNLSPANVTSASGSAGDAQVSLSWTNPADSDFEHVVALVSTSAVSDTPVEGSTYSVGNTIGSATVACVSTGTSCTDTNVSNGTAYHYKIFAKDSRNNYSATGVVPTGSPFTPEAAITPTTTLGNGTDPSSSTVEPGSAEQYLDQFTFRTNIDTDTVTALVVTTANTAAISEVKIMSEDLATQYFATVSSPSGNTWSFSGGTTIPVTTSSASYRILVSLKTHAALGSGSHAVTGAVSSFTSTNTQSGSDSAGTTLTVDNEAPANVTSATGTAGDAAVSLSWANPADADFNTALVLRQASSEVSDTPVEGSTYSAGGTLGSATVACVTSSTSCTDTSLANGTAYHYKIFAKDSRNNYSATGVVPTGSPVTPVAAATPSPTPSPSEPPGSSRPADPPDPVATTTPVIVEVEEELTEVELQSELQKISAQIESIKLQLALIESRAPRPLPVPVKKERIEIAKLETEEKQPVRKTLFKKPSEITIRELPAPLPLPQLEVQMVVRPLETGWDEVVEKLSRGEGELTRQAQEIIARGDGWGSRIAARAEVAKLAVAEGIKNARNSVESKIALTEDSAVALRDTLREKLDTQLEETSKLVSVMPPLPTLTVEPRLAKENTKSEDVIILQSGELELIAAQNKPVQTITSFRFTSKVEPSKPAVAVGGTFKYQDADQDGVWTAEGQLPPTTGRYTMNARISYADGGSKDLRVTTLIDPEGYVYEKTSRGELRVAGSKVTLWQKAGEQWVRWPAEKFNQKNPQTTDRTGEYSFLAPEGEYYLEITAKDYKSYKGRPFKLEEALPVNQNIELEYTGAGL